ncbi:hypothetical protein [Tetragenococcus solitarius]|uniref:Uncharacterized protein n=1 Tax=Tetragenococcus solitarius TaxID=71453 RepID=A0ABP6KXV3_9ENTE|nr:hypothetical protein [Tetragenococcus solitarius]
MIGRRRASKHWAQASKNLRTGQKISPKKKSLTKQQRKKQARRKGTMIGAIRSAFRK